MPRCGGYPAVNCADGDADISLLSKDGECPLEPEKEEMLSTEEIDGLLKEIEKEKKEGEDGNN